jgi:hypothetical protein
MGMRISIFRTGWLVATAALAAVAVGSWVLERPAGVNAAVGEPSPVLVELFTSEGCSSCPPADALLARLDAKQPVAGARVIVLSEHVTYWNSLGWRDPFSFEAMTERQQKYAERFGLGEVYTPQAVVDGGAELVGSDERGLLRAVAKAADSPKTPVLIESAEVAGGEVRFSVRGGDGKTELMAALAEDAAQSNVLRGENGGHLLRHVAVVRDLLAMGAGVADGRPLTLKVPAGSGTMRLVVFLVDRRSGRVVGLAERAVARA